MLILAGWKKVSPYAPESAPPKNEHEPNRYDEDSSDDREGELNFYDPFTLRAMNVFTISRARSVCGPSFATHSCSQFSNS